VSALQTAGLNVPMLEYTAGNTPQVFQKINNKNFHALRESVLAESSQMLTSAAAKAGVSDSAKTTFFTDGWIATETIVDGLKKCGANCDGAGLIKTLDGTSKLSIEGNLAFGSLAFSSSRHAGLSAVQVYGWDGTKDVATG